MEVCAMCILAQIFDFVGASQLFIYNQYSFKIHIFIHFKTISCPHSHSIHSKNFSFHFNFDYFHSIPHSHFLNHPFQINFHDWTLFQDPFHVLDWSWSLIFCGWLVLYFQLNEHLNHWSLTWWNLPLWDIFSFLIYMRKKIFSFQQLK